MDGGGSEGDEDGGGGEGDVDGGGAHGGGGRKGGVGGDGAGDVKTYNLHKVKPVGSPSRTFSGGRLKYM